MIVLRQHLGDELRRQRQQPGSHAAPGLRRRAGLARVPLGDRARPEGGQQRAARLDLRCPRAPALASCCATSATTSRSPSWPPPRRWLPATAPTTTAPVMPTVPVPACPPPSDGADHHRSADRRTRTGGQCHGSRTVADPRRSRQPGRRGRTARQSRWPRVARRARGGQGHGLQPLPRPRRGAARTAARRARCPAARTAPSIREGSASRRPPGGSASTPCSPACALTIPRW